MSPKDRTGEFFSAVQSLRSRQGLGVASGAGRRPHPLREQNAQFGAVARKIGQDINNTFAKLEKLTILARNKSIFDDRPVEIQELTYIIKQDINGLNKQIARLQQIQAQRGGGKSQNQKHSSNVVVSLQSKLAAMSNDFKSVLEVRTQNLREQQERREQFSQPIVPVSISNAHQQSSSSPLFREESGGDADFSLDVSGSAYQQLQFANQEASYIQSRSDAVQSIEATIVELGGIFQQLAHLVHAQDEQLQRIDQNVNDAELNIEAAHGELLKYFEGISSNRWLMIKIFAVLIAFFVFFVVFMA